MTAPEHEQHVYGNLSQFEKLDFVTAYTTSTAHHAGTLLPRWIDFDLGS